MKPDILPADERCEFCKRKEATILCDFPWTVVSSLDFKKHTITCDRKICEDCATHLSVELDFCPRCMEKLRNMKPGRDKNEA